MAQSKITYIDQVIEQGTSGIWTYRKWESGIKECWCKTTTGTSYTMSANGSLYVSTDPPFEIALPNGLFTETPNIQVQVLMGGGMWLKATGSSSASKVCYQVVRTNNTVANITGMFYCIGS